MGAPIAVGTCNWADHTDFYPAELEHGRRQRDKLSFYAEYFPLVEIDTTFYGIPRPQVVEGWVERTPEQFRFNIKAYRSLTGHEREDRIPRKPTADEVRDFMAALEPLRASGKLVAVHYQFPPWLTNRPEAREWLLAARDRHPDDLLAIEFRHRSWFDHDAWPATEDLLRELECVYVGVDAPQIGSATAPPLLAVTSPRLCIARFHGRNRETWYTSGPTSGDRFNYLYTPAELAEWVPAMRAASDDGVPVHVLLNNNRSNYAVVNAFDFGAMLGLGLPRPPEPVIETLRERDGSVPEWVGRSSPVPAPTQDPSDKPVERESGNQLTLALSDTHLGDNGQGGEAYASRDSSGGLAMAMASSRRNDRGRRPAASGVVMRNEAATHEVEVSRALNQWAVTVTSLADNRMITQDFFSRRWEAVARAEDFVRLLNRSEPPPGW